jgi:hypothetical protein
VSAGVLVNIDVPELQPAIDFYEAAVGAHFERSLDDDVAELTYGSSVIYLLRKPSESRVEVRHLLGSVRPRVLPHRVCRHGVRVSLAKPGR